VSLKRKTQFVCQQCSYLSTKWYGKCPDCGSWNSLVQETLNFIPDRHERQSGVHKQEPKALNSILGDDLPRLLLPLSEFNRLLGNGLTRGSVVLLAGDPGVGKSTLLLQLLGAITSEKKTPLLYVTGEESTSQIKLRAQRLNITNEAIHVLAQTNLAEILTHLENMNPQIAVIDSVQTLYWPELSAIPGSISQVREVADRLVRLAKQRNISLFFIGHVTKEGSIAGPMALEHLVDTVLYFEGDRGQPYRILRAIKNRFGPTDEIAVFDMREEGLKEINNPSELFLRDRPTDTPGTVVYPAIEGSRPLLVEIQGLATRSSFGVPMRTAVGFDRTRLTVLLAVLEKRAGLNFISQDVYVNIVGGLQIQEPSADLAIISCVLSSLLGRVFPNRAVAFGEVGLAGEVRAVGKSELRLKEALKLGFTTAIVPPNLEPEFGKLHCIRVSSVNDLIDIL